MKKQLLFLCICFCLLIPGSGFITGLNAQTKGKRTARTPNSQAKSQKTPSALKSKSLREILANRKNNNLNVGDPCDTATPITLGTPANGNLASGDCQLGDGTFIDFYSFNGTSGQPINISMNSGAFDTYLYLLDDQGNVIDENDDSGSTTDSRIPIDGGVITLPYTGEFIIGANSFEPSSGAYSLALNTDAACTTTALNYNQTVNGSLAGTDCAVNIGGDPFFTDLYTFNGTAGQQISIAMNSTVVDPYLILHTPSGAGSVEDDDGGGAPNARIPMGSGTFTLPETGTYTIEASSFDPFEVGAYTLVLTGPTVTPMSHALFDFDGDGKTDISIFRPSVGQWWYLKSSDSGNAAFAFGNNTDILAPGDFTGDGKTDICFFRPSEGTWYVLRSEDSSFFAFAFGSNGDIPAPADYDGDGKTDPAVFRPSEARWYINRSTDGFLIVNFGFSEDKPVVADYDGDGKADIAIFRPSVGQWWYLRSSDGGNRAYAFGLSSDRPVPGDYTGDGKADIAFWRPSDGFWYILRSEDDSFFSFPFGATGDIPAPGDYDGDGKFDPTVFRPTETTWYVSRSSNGLLVVNFGFAEDKPVPSAFIP